MTKEQPRFSTAASHRLSPPSPPRSPTTHTQAASKQAGRKQQRVTMSTAAVAAHAPRHKAHAAPSHVPEKPEGPCERGASATTMYQQLAHEVAQRTAELSAEQALEEERWAPWTSREHMESSLAWRRAYQPARLTVDVVAQGLREYGVAQYGTTRCGQRIVWVENFGRAQLPDAVPAVPQAALAAVAATETCADAAEWACCALPQMPCWYAAVLTYRTIVYTLETCLGGGARQVAVVMNCAGMTRHTIDERVTRMLTDVTTLCYPDCLGDVVLYNAPRWVVIAWKTLGRFMPRYWRQRLHISAGSPTSILRELADPAQLPRRFGGTCDDTRVSAAAFIAQQTRLEQQLGLVRPDAEALAQRASAASAYSATLCWVTVCKDVAGQSGVLREPIAREAWLKKQGGLVPVWRKYYFVLRGTTLLYKNHPHDSIPNNAVDLARATALPANELPPERRNKVPGTHTCVMVIDTPQRSFTILFPCENDRNAWLGSIVAAQQQLHRDQQRTLANSSS